MKKTNFLLSSILIMVLLVSCNKKQQKSPADVQFHMETLKRIGSHGDNWCITWVEDGSQITSMDDGNWLENPEGGYHNHLYRLKGSAESFTRHDVEGYPRFFGGNQYPGWFGYGVIAINHTIYSMVSKTPGINWSGPFRGVKMLKSMDNGKTWYRVNSAGETRLIEPSDTARDLITADEMFFMEEFGKNNHGQIAYPFSWVSFVQNGRAGTTSKDGYVYIYAPESSNTYELLLARVKKEDFEIRSKWEYFQKWNGSEAEWTADIQQRGPVYIYPEKSKDDKYFGWYSWLPSIVWNEGLGLYIMVNGGTYAGPGMTNSQEDYYDSWMHTKTGSMGFWYSENPYGPWKQFYFTDYWIVDDEKNRTYQPKLSPKWISDDGKEMVLIWSDAMENEKGQSHSVNYMWNQMKISIVLE